MWNITICDSDEHFAQEFGAQVVQFYREKGFSVKLTYCEDGDSFTRIMEHPVNLIFLNTRLSDMNGYVLAQRLRDRGLRPLLVFLGDYDEDVFDAFSYHPFQYIRKNNWKQDLMNVLKELWRVEHKNRTILIRRKRGDLMIPVDNIVYMESKGHYVLIHCVGEDYQVRDKLSNYEERLKNHYFVHTSKSFLVNCAHIESVGTVVRLKSGEKLNCSKSRKQETEKTHQKYLEEMSYCI